MAKCVCLGSTFHRARVLVYSRDPFISPRRGTVSIPFSYSCKKSPKDAEDQLEAALGAVNAIKQIHGTVFTVRHLSASTSSSAHELMNFRPSDRQSLRAALQVCPGPLAIAVPLAHHVVLRASGNVVDYMYAKAGIKYSYSVHLRDTGTVRLCSNMLAPRLCR